MTLNCIRCGEWIGPGDIYELSPSNRDFDDPSDTYEEAMCGACQIATNLEDAITEYG